MLLCRDMIMLLVVLPCCILCTVPHSLPCCVRCPALVPSPPPLSSCPQAVPPSSRAVRPMRHLLMHAQEVMLHIASYISMFTRPIKLVHPTYPACEVCQPNQPLDEVAGRVGTALMLNEFMPSVMVRCSWAKVCTAPSSDRSLGMGRQHL